MGLFDILLDVADVLSDPASAMHDKKYKVSCTTLEIFEIGTQWKGTARVHGAGEHVKTVKVNYQTTITLPYRDDDSRYTRRGLLRKQLREWVADTFTQENIISKESIILNPSENCLSVEGFGIITNGKWMLVDDAIDATNFCSFKLSLTDTEDDSRVGYNKLNELFMEDTLGYVSSVDVSEGF